MYDEISESQHHHLPNENTSKQWIFFNYTQALCFVSVKFLLSRFFLTVFRSAKVESRIWFYLGVFVDAGKVFRL